MNWMIYHFASGGAFFIGITMVFFSALLGISNKNCCRRCASVSCVIGAVFVATSATPMSYLFYAFFGFITATWWISTSRKKKLSSLRWQRFHSILLMANCIGGMAMEFPHRLLPKIESTKSDTVVIFGDSVTAGIGEESVTWPHILSREKSISIHARFDSFVATRSRTDG